MCSCVDTGSQVLSKMVIAAKNMTNVHMLHSYLKVLIQTRASILITSVINIEVM